MTALRVRILWKFQWFSDRVPVKKQPERSLGHNVGIQAAKKANIFAGGRLNSWEFREFSSLRGHGI